MVFIILIFILILFPVFLHFQYTFQYTESIQWILFTLYKYVKHIWLSIRSNSNSITHFRFQLQILRREKKLLPLTSFSNIYFFSTSFSLHLFLYIFFSTSFSLHLFPYIFFLHHFYIKKRKMFSIRALWFLRFYWK